MAKKTALERAEERINQLQTSRTKELEQHAARIEAARTRAAEARARMGQTSNAGDLAGFKAAKLDLIDAETEIEFSTNHTSSLQGSALVDEAEAKRVVQEIMDEEKDAQETDEDAIIECVAQLENIATRNKRRHEKLANVLQAWYRDICKDESHRVLDDNRKVFVLVENIINDNQFRQIAGQPVGTARRWL